MLTDGEAAFCLTVVRFVLTDLSSAVAKLSKTFPPSTNRDRLSPFPSQLCGLNAGNNHRPADQEPWLRNSGKCWPRAAVNKKQKGQKERKLQAAEATVVPGEQRGKKHGNKEPVYQIPTILLTLSAFFKKLASSMFHCAKGSQLRPKLEHQNSLIQHQKGCNTANAYKGARAGLIIRFGVILT